MSITLSAAAFELRYQHSNVWHKRSFVSGVGLETKQAMRLPHGGLNQPTLKCHPLTSLSGGSNPLHIDKRR